MSTSNDSYFNSTATSGGALSGARAKAASQTFHVLAIYKDFNRLTPSQAWNLGKTRGFNWLLTSVRRSITTLTRRGDLTKTETVRGGPYGRQETVWEFIA